MKAIYILIALLIAFPVHAMADSVADPSEMATPNELCAEGLTAVHAAALNDGVYDITVDSSSSMFRIVSCELTVNGESMTARMTMSGTGYMYLFMGTGAEAAQADSSTYIHYEQDDAGSHVYTVPVETLNSEISCSAFSRKKQKWYDRNLIFRADSLPLDALKDEYKITAASLGLSDGNYSVAADLKGGSGRATINTPAAMRIKDGVAWVTVTFDSPNYDYMIVDGEKYYCINAEGNSSFEIPIAAFDWGLGVKADTVAMSQPYEIDYTLRFDSASIAQVDK